MSLRLPGEGTIGLKEAVAKLIAHQQSQSGAT